MRARSFPVVLAAGWLAVLAIDPGARDAGAQPTPPTAARSPAPTAKEWTTAADIKLTRTSPAARGCVARQVREWVRVRCPQATKTFALSLLGGSNEGLSFWIAVDDAAQPGEVQFPVRVGDRRVVQFWIQGEAKDEGAPRPGLVLQEQWVEGEPAAKISVL